MKKYKVTLLLMVNPSKNDETFEKEYIVEAENERKAYQEASKMQDEDEDDIKYRTLFNYKVDLL